MSKEKLLYFVNTKKMLEGNIQALFPVSGKTSAVNTFISQQEGKTENTGTFIYSIVGGCGSAWSCFNERKLPYARFPVVNGNSSKHL